MSLPSAVYSFGIVSPSRKAGLVSSILTAASGSTTLCPPLQPDRQAQDSRKRNAIVLVVESMRYPFYQGQRQLHCLANPPS